MAQLKDLIVNGVCRVLGKVYSPEFVGKLTGNADTATSATKATQDESGNNIKSSYASSISISDHTITLKNKNGSSLGTVTVPDNNTDTKVTQTVTTSNASYPLLLAPNGQTATATTTSYFDSGVTLNPSTNTIAANISGSSASCTGNAATATKADKLTTARTISLTGASTGSTTFDGSGNVSIATTRRSCIVGQGTSTNTNPYYKFASYTSTVANDDRAITFKVHKGYGDNSTATGILTAHFRTKGTIGVFENAQMVWEYADSGIDPSKFFLCYKETSGTSLDIQLYVCVDGAYSFYHFDVLSEGSRSTNGSYWTLYSANSAGQSASLPEGYTVITSSFSTIKNNISGNAETATKASHFVAGTQTATTGSWTGNLTGVSALFDGLMIDYWLPTSGSGNVTLNLTLDSGSTTGALPVYINAITRCTTQISANNIIRMIYRDNITISGTSYSGWWITRAYDTNDFSQLRYENSKVYAGTNGIWNYSLIALDSNNQWQSFVTSSGTGTSKGINTTAKFKLEPQILYYARNNNATVGNLVSNTYSLYLAFPYLDLRYSCNCTTSQFTTNTPIYIECTIDNDGYFSITENCITQTLTTGYYYIYLGTTYSNAYQLSLSVSHPVYYYDGINLTDYNTHRMEVMANDITNSTMPITDFTGESNDLNTLIQSGVHAGFYQTDGNTLNTPYKAGVTNAVAGLILSYANSGTYGVQYAFISGKEITFSRTMNNGVISNWSTGFLPLTGGAVSGTIYPTTALGAQSGTTTNPWSYVYARYHMIYDENKVNCGGYQADTAGTTSTQGESYCIIGNNKETGTAGNSRGRVRLYNVNTGYTDIVSSSSTTNRTITLPNATGTVALMSNLNRTNSVQTANTAYTTYMARGIAANTTAMKASSTSLTNGCIYLQYQ